MGIKRLIAAGVSFLTFGFIPTDTPRFVDASDVKELVASRKGEVVLLNFWATWCPPCAREFPELVEVEREYRGRGVAVISVSIDFPDKMETELLPFLEEHQPDFEVYLKKDGEVTEFTRTIDPEWKGTLPATFFYDRRGGPSVKRYSEMTRPEMERILKALLEEPIP
jgi:thiol-disulfide isomerase/thioredoxin